MTLHSTLPEETRFLIDFNFHAVASALGLPIPDEAAALMYQLDLAALTAYQSEIDEELAQSAAPFAGHAGLARLAQHITPAAPLLCIGDSITTYRRSYAHHLRHLLAPLGLPVLNRGFSGYTSTHGLELTYTQFLHLQPGVVCIKYGVNDCKQFDGAQSRPLVSADEYADNLRRIVQAFQAHTRAYIVLITPTPVVEDIVNGNPDIQAMRLVWDNARLHQYADLALQVAAQAGVMAVDVRHALGQPPQAALFCPDGLHPNLAGQVILLEHVLQGFALT